MQNLHVPKNIFIQFESGSVRERKGVVLSSFDGRSEEGRKRADKVLQQ